MRKSRADDKDAPITNRDLKRFDHRVTDYIMWLVTDQGVKTRMIDPNHVLLYPPDGKTRPFKVSVSRPAEQSLQFLRKFARENQLEEE